MVRPTWNLTRSRKTAAGIVAGSLLRWSAALALTLLSVAARAQDPYVLCQPALRMYDSHHGLPADTVHSLLLDSSGTLWAGTLEGPARFNGRGWESVHLPDSSPSNYIRALLRDHSGAQWFGTQDGGLWRLKDDAWTNFTAARELPSNRVNCLLETQAPGGGHVLWVGTGGGIARFADGTWTIATRSHGLASDFIWKLKEIKDPDGKPRLWAATQGGLCMQEGEAWRTIGTAEGFRGGTTNDILESWDADGRRHIWVSCWGFGVASWDGRTWTHFEAPSAFPSRFPTSLCAAAGTVWAGTFDNALAWFDGTAWRALGQAEGNPVTGVYALVDIPFGKPSLVLGTRGSGVAFLDLGGWRTLDVRMGLPSNEATSFAETQDAFWIGTSKGLVRWDGKRGPQVERMGSAAAPDYFNSLLVTRGDGGRETLWAATLRGVYERAPGGWRLHRDLPILQGSVHCLLETRAKDGTPTLWAGSDLGLACFRGGAWHVCLPEPGRAPIIVNALCATRDSDGEPVVWAWRASEEAAGPGPGTAPACRTSRCTPWPPPPAPPAAPGSGPARREEASPGSGPTSPAPDGRPSAAAPPRASSPIPSRDFSRAPEGGSTPPPPRACCASPSPRPVGSPRRCPWRTSPPTTACPPTP